MNDALNWDSSLLKRRNQILNN